MQRLLVVIAIFGWVLGVSGTPAMAQGEAACERIIEMSRSATELLYATIEALPDDIEKIVNDGGIAMLANPLVRDEIVGPLPNTGPSDLAIRDYLAASLNAIPALDGLAKTSALLALNCR